MGKNRKKNGSDTAMAGAESEKVILPVSPGAEDEEGYLSIPSGIGDEIPFFSVPEGLDNEIPFSTTPSPSAGAERENRSDDPLWGEIRSVFESLVFGNMTLGHHGVMYFLDNLKSARPELFQDRGFLKCMISEAERNISESWRAFCSLVRGSMNENKEDGYREYVRDWARDGMLMGCSIWNDLYRCADDSLKTDKQLVMEVIDRICRVRDYYYLPERELLLEENEIREVVGDALAWMYDLIPKKMRRDEDVRRIMSESVEPVTLYEMMTTEEKLDDENIDRLLERLKADYLPAEPEIYNAKVCELLEMWVDAVEEDCFLTDACKDICDLERQYPALPEDFRDEVAYVSPLELFDWLKHTHRSYEDYDLSKYDWIGARKHSIEDKIEIYSRYMSRYDVVEKESYGLSPDSLMQFRYWQFTFNEMMMPYQSAARMFDKALGN